MQMQKNISWLQLILTIGDFNPKILSEEPTQETVKLLLKQSRINELIHSLPR